MVLLLVVAVVYMYQKTPIPTDVSEAALQQSSTVYFSNGKTAVGTFTADGIDRQMLTSNQIPAVMKNAIVAAEDRHFYSEGGISVSGIVRSAYEDVKGGGNLQGGSTLTEEFAKNYYTTIGTSRTMSTKIKEIFVSIKLSHEKSKDWIITQYLNTVPFGNNAYGVAAASQTLLRRARDEADRLPVGDARGPGQRAELLHPRPEWRGGLHGAGRALALRADQHGQGRRAHPAAGRRADVPEGADEQRAGDQLDRLQGLHHAAGRERAQVHLRVLQ